MRDEVALEQLVVERPGHGADVRHERHDGQPGDLPRAVVRADAGRRRRPRAMASSRKCALTNGQCDGISSIGTCCMRIVVERFAAEVAPAFVEDAPPLGLALLRKRFREIAHGQPVASAQDVPRQRADARAPAAQRRLGAGANGARGGAVEEVFDALQQRVLAAAAHGFIGVF